MRLVIADTGPVNYLVLIQHIDLLPTLFRKAVLPSVVQRELEDWHTPHSVRTWMTNRAAWVEVSDPPESYLDDESLKGLDQGEQAAIALAVAINADLVLMDGPAQANEFPLPPGDPGCATR